MINLLEKQIISDANNGDTTVLHEILKSLSIEMVYNSLGDKEQESLVTYYEIHVGGVESYSTSIKCNYPLMCDEDIVNLAIELDVIDCHDARDVDYTNELSFDEWNTHFNFED